MGRYYVNGKLTEEGKSHVYKKFHSSAKAKSERAARNSARRAALRKGTVQKGDNREVHHLDSNPSHNSSSNLRVISRTANRSKREDSRKRGSRRNKRKWGKD